MRKRLPDFGIALSEGKVKKRMIWRMTRTNALRVYSPRTEYAILLTKPVPTVDQLRWNASGTVQINRVGNVARTLRFLQRECVLLVRKYCSTKDMLAHTPSNTATIWVSLRAFVATSPTVNARARFIRHAATIEDKLWNDFVQVGVAMSGRPQSELVKPSHAFRCMLAM